MFNYARGVNRYEDSAADSFIAADSEGLMAMSVQRLRIYGTIDSIWMCSRMYVLSLHVLTDNRIFHILSNHISV